jgi:hypothetical protein
VRNAGLIALAAVALMLFAPSTGNAQDPYDFMVGRWVNSGGVVFDVYSTGHVEGQHDFLVEWFYEYEGYASGSFEASVLWGEGDVFRIYDPGYGYTYYGLLGGLGGPCEFNCVLFTGWGYTYFEGWVKAPGEFTVEPTTVEGGQCYDIYAANSPYMLIDASFLFGGAGFPQIVSDYTGGLYDDWIPAWTWLDEYGHAEICASQFAVGDSYEFLSVWNPGTAYWNLFMTTMGAVYEFDPGPYLIDIYFTYVYDVTLEIAAAQPTSLWLETGSIPQGHCSLMAVGNGDKMWSVYLRFSANGGESPSGCQAPPRAYAR